LVIEKEFDGFEGGTGIVDAKESGALEEGDSIEGYGASKGIVGSDAQRFVNHAFATEGGEQWFAEEGSEFVETVKQFVILLDGFCEAKTGIEDDILNTEAVERIEAGGEVFREVVDDVGITRMLLHL
jgi:hypothetical protein